MIITLIIPIIVELVQIALIAVAGGARTGKSSLLNYFIMYFRARSSNPDIQKV